MNKTGGSEPVHSHRFAAGISEGQQLINTGIVKGRERNQGRLLSLQTVYGIGRIGIIKMIAELFAECDGG